MQDQDHASTIDAIKAAQPDAADITDAERELLAYAKVLTETPARITDEQTDRLRSVGWNDQQIAEAVYIISLFAFFNRLADAFGLTDQDFSLR